MESYGYELAQKYAEEELIVSQDSPHCIDAGSTFICADKTDPYKIVVHTNACFWLAVYAALHFDAYHDRLETSLHDKIAYNKILPHRLKEICGVIGLDTRATPDHQRMVCDYLKIAIEIHAWPYDTIEPKYDHPLHTIHLYEGLGHWVVFIDPSDYPLAQKFAPKFANVFRYEAMIWNPLKTNMLPAEFVTSGAIEAQKKYDALNQRRMY